MNTALVAVQTALHAAVPLSNKRRFLDYTSVEIKKSWAISNRLSGIPGGQVSVKHDFPGVLKPVTAATGSAWLVFSFPPFPVRFL